MTSIAHIPLWLSSMPILQATLNCYTLCLRPPSLTLTCKLAPRASYKQILRKIHRNCTLTSHPSHPHRTLGISFSNPVLTILVAVTPYSSGHFISTPLLSSVSASANQIPVIQHAFHSLLIIPCTHHYANKSWPRPHGESHSFSGHAFRDLPKTHTVEPCYSCFCSNHGFPCEIFYPGHPASLPGLKLGVPLKPTYVPLCRRPLPVLLLSLLPTGPSDLSTSSNILTSAPTSNPPKPIRNNNSIPINFAAFLALPLLSIMTLTGTLTTTLTLTTALHPNMLMPIRSTIFIRRAALHVVLQAKHQHRPIKQNHYNISNLPLPTSSKQYQLFTYTYISPHQFEKHINHKLLLPIIFCPTFSGSILGPLWYSLHVACAVGKTATSSHESKSLRDKQTDTNSSHIFTYFLLRSINISVAGYFFPSYFTLPFGILGPLWYSLWCCRKQQQQQQQQQHQQHQQQQQQQPTLHIYLHISLSSVR